MRRFYSDSPCEVTQKCLGTKSMTFNYLHLLWITLTSWELIFKIKQNPKGYTSDNVNSECVCVLSCVQLSATPWTVARQVPLSMEFSRQEYWSGLPFPIPRNLSIPGIKPMSLAVAGGFFIINATWEAPGCQLYNVSFTIQQKTVNNLYVQQKESTW